MTNKKRRVDPAPAPIALTLTEAAWARCEARVRALPKALVGGARIDVTHAASVAIAATRNLLAQREAVDAMIRAAPWELFEGVHDVALAAQHADLLHRIAQKKPTTFGDIRARVHQLRSVLHGDLIVQVARGRVPARMLADIRPGDGSMRDKAHDLECMAVAYRTDWERIVGRTTVEREEVDEASALANEILSRLGEQKVEKIVQAGTMGTAELRRRAFSLLAADYDRVRQHGAMFFWSWPGGWERYVPSLWSGRSAEAAGVRGGLGGGSGEDGGVPGV